MSARLRFLAISLLLGAFVVQAFTAIRTKSATWDETNYFGMGDYLLRTGRWDVPSSILHPPLAFYLDAVPVLFSDADRSVWHRDAVRCDDGSSAGPRGCESLDFLGAADPDRGRLLLSSPANHDDRLLLASRVMTILQAAVLGVFVYRFAAALFGAAAGLIALTFFAFCPNMLAHGSLITPDMTLTACSFVALYFLREALVTRRRPAFLLAGITLGLALLAKFTALLLLPVEALIVVAFLVGARRAAARERQGARPTAAGPNGGQQPRIALWLAAAAGCAALVVLVAYRFDPTPYLQGLEVQKTHGGHSAFLMGKISADGWWYYCLAAFALKTPIPLLLFPAAAVAIDAVRAFRPTDGAGPKAGAASADAPKTTTPFDRFVLWLPVVALFAFFSVELRSIGLRYVLPAYPFLFVIAAGACVSIARHRVFAGKRRLLLALPLAWYVLGTALAWPDHLAYFNESVGGPENGYRYLVDSNLDWGQDLKGLKACMERRGIDRIYFSYFGLDTPTRYGIDYVWLPSYELPNPNPQPSVNIPRGSYLAISVTNLQGVYMTPPTMFRWLDRFTPIEKIGHSIFVYRLE